MGREIERHAAELRTKIANEGFLFDRRFLFRVLSMGHSQLAEYIGARGPNTAVNAACASTTQALTLARDWVRSGRWEWLFPRPLYVVDPVSFQRMPQKLAYGKSEKQSKWACLARLHLRLSEEF